MHAEQLWAKFLECRVCEKGYDSDGRCPMLLLCGHTLCKACCRAMTQVKERVVCPYESREDIRDFEDLSPSHHYLQSIYRVEVGCYWHFHKPGIWYCPENLVSACQECKEAKEDWDWKTLQNVDLPGLFVRGIQGMFQDKEFKDYVYGWNPELKDRYRILYKSTAREKQTLYFNILSYRDQTDYIVPVSILEPPSNYYRELQGGMIEVKRFRKILPNKYTRDFRSVQTWKIDLNEDQSEFLTFSVSCQVLFCGIAIGKECIPAFDSKLISIVLIQNNTTNDQDAIELTRKVPYTKADRCIERIMFDKEASLQPNSPYTLKVKYDGRRTYYGDPLTSCNPIRGPGGFEIRFLDTEFVQMDILNGNGRKSGPILKLYLRKVVI